MQDPEQLVGQVQIFRAGQFYSSNVSGGALAGAGAAILMFTVMCIVVWMNPDRQNILLAATLMLIIVVSVLTYLPGNMSAVYPYAVAVEEGKGLQLYFPLKKVYIPIEDVLDVRKSFLQGYVVRLKRSHRLLNAFVIHSFFGNQAQPLVDAIREEIRRRAS